jgi:hypothetical protein
VFDLVGRQTPPPVTHPEFYFGFVGVGLVWQIAFLVIASDPRRYRPMMIVSALEKASYVIAVVVLYLEHRTELRILTSAMGDAILGLLFIAAFFTTRSTASNQSKLWRPSGRVKSATRARGRLAACARFV